MKSIKVLSIDGGGIRGIIPAIILGELQKRLARNLYEGGKRCQVPFFFRNDAVGCGHGQSPASGCWGDDLPRPEPRELSFPAFQRVARR